MPHFGQPFGKRMAGALRRCRFACWQPSTVLRRLALHPAITFALPALAQQAQNLEYSQYFS
jgi:hypothetical protein